MRATGPILQTRKPIPRNTFRKITYRPKTKNGL